MSEHLPSGTYESLPAVPAKLGEAALTDPNSGVQDPASKIATDAQKQMNIIDAQDFLDEDYFELLAARNEALESAEELDFELVQLGDGDWSMLVQLNAMHDKFKRVSTEALSTYLGEDDGAYEYRTFRIRNIVADHAPALLTENVRTILDPSQPQWRRSSAHAGMLLKKNTPRSNVDDIQVACMPTSLPVSWRSEYLPEDEAVIKPLAAMTEEELSLYVRAGSVAAVKEKGLANFGNLNLPARETLLTRRLFETVSKSSSRSEKEQAGSRNRSLENQPVLQQGDLIHATSAAVFEQIVSNGLQCGEAIEGISRSAIKYPFTVSFLEVNQEVTDGTSMADQLRQLKNEPYGAVNVVMRRDETTTEVATGQKIGVPNQRQIFGGVPSTEIKSVIIREHIDMKHTTERVVRSIIQHGMFIPVYNGANGEPLLTSRQYDELMVGVH